MPRATPGPVPRLKALAGPLLLVGVGVALMTLFDLRRVADAEMAPSILSGDWVLLGPGDPAPGQVVAIDDPLEPGRRVLRRLVAVGPSPVQLNQGVLRVDGEPARLREMGRSDGMVVMSEANTWLIQHQVRSLREPSHGADLVAGQVWLLADNRDSGLDSRWWGPLPATQLGQRVWLRVGSSDAWRPRWSPEAQDGPWLPPSRQGG